MGLGLPPLVRQSTGQVRLQIGKHTHTLMTSRHLVWSGHCCPKMGWSHFSRNVWQLYMGFVIVLYQGEVHFLYRTAQTQCFQPSLCIRMHLPGPLCISLDLAVQRTFSAHKNTWIFFGQTISILSVQSPANQYSSQLALMQWQQTTSEGWKKPGSIHHKKFCSNCSIELHLHLRKMNPVEEFWASYLMCLLETHSSLVNQVCYWFISGQTFSAVVVGQPVKKYMKKILFTNKS